MQMHERHTARGGGAPGTNPLDHDAPVEIPTSGHRVQVDGPLQPAIEIVCEVMQHEMSHDVVIV